MKFSNTSVMNIDNAIRAVRNPMDSWELSDSRWCNWLNEEDCKKHKDVCHGEREGSFYIIGDKDLKLCQNLIKAGDSDAKFLRQIFVSVDIECPLYFVKELDQYRIGVTTNSCSTMHKIMSKPITADCFEIKDIDDCEKFIFNRVVNDCEAYRQLYLSTKEQKYWKALIRLLPESWLQMRTWTGSYANIRNMYWQRKNHKLAEWSNDFCNWVKTLPYAEELICYGGE